jgi:hypothetical protein
MADSAVAITAGTGTNIDTRTEGTNSNHRQVIVIGDPATNAGVAPVDATAGLKVDLGADNDVTVSGTVTANLAAGTNNIGDVDVLSIVPGTGATALGKAIDSAAGATDTGVAILAIRDDSLSALTPAEGDYAPLRVSSTGALHITGAAAGTEYTEDVAATADPLGGMMMAVRRDTLSTSEVSADGDNIALKATSKGELHTRNLALEALVPALGQLASAASQSVVRASDAEPAHDAADSGIGTKIAAKAIASQHGLTLVAAADRTDLFAGLDGIQLTRPHTNLESIVTGNASNTDGTSTSCIATAGAGVKQYLTSVVLTNTSSSMIYVELKSGTTVKATIPLPATSGAIFNPPVPLPPNAADEAWSFDPSAATSTVYCTMIGFKSKI